MPPVTPCAEVQEHSPMTQSKQSPHIKCRRNLHLTNAYEVNGEAFGMYDSPHRYTPHLCSAASAGRSSSKDQSVPSLVSTTTCMSYFYERDEGYEEQSKNVNGNGRSAMMELQCKVPSKPKRTNTFRSAVYQKMALQAGIFTSPPVTSHPLYELRRLGVSLIKTPSCLSYVVGELVIPESYTVRLNDLSGRSLHVFGNGSAESPIASYIPHGYVQDGSSFVLRLLHDDQPTSSTSTTSFLRSGTGRRPDSAPQGINDVAVNGSLPNLIPSWCRYAITAAMYSSLAGAGFCDLFFPFLSLQRVSWPNVLEKHAYLRLDLMTKPTTRSMLRPYLGYDKSNVVPVAVVLPMTMKGTVRRVDAETNTMSISTLPFSDAEVFQLFYLQLIFRAVYDVQFTNMTLEGGKILRSDRIAIQTSGRQPLAFEHPNRVDKWLLFPPRSSIMYFTSLEDVLIPRYTENARYRESMRQRLFGATPSLQCAGLLGRRVVVEWASNRVVSTPEDAMVALGELFDLFMPLYGVKRLSIWQAPVPPRVYRCGVASLTNLWMDDSDISFIRKGVKPPSWHLNERKMVKAGRLLEAMRQQTLDVEGGSERVQQQTIESPVGEILEQGDEKRTLPLLGGLDEGAQEESEERGYKCEDTLVDHWLRYVDSGDITVFDGTTEPIEVVRFIAGGGSGLVYEGRYGPERVPVAVKCLVIPCGMSHECYVRESLTNVAFAAFFNEMENAGIVRGVRVHDFVVSSIPPKGMPEEDVQKCSRSCEDGSTPKLCYIVSTLMDGVIGRFLTDEDSDYDPVYDTLVNSPLCDAEVFQFIYTQLALRAIFDCTILDLMLNNQLRGDNVGFIRLLRNAPANTVGCSSYKGIFVIFQPYDAAEPRYLCFPVEPSAEGKLTDPLRLICFIDFGQGKQPLLEELTQRGLIGQTIVDSCVHDDGFGRYWPLDRLYCKYLECCGAVAESVREWGADACVDSPQAAEALLQRLVDLYSQTYGVAALPAEGLGEYVVFHWTQQRAERLRQRYAGISVKTP
ncbi:hypothetical protein ERJ75_001354300 [Trypanosoma vivax]|uniref:Protein kinase domain-containing protein n=1 Tax=Trypanosoma vivax (strain Y486) TaxID=1055687 RepID=G0UCV7_TRYVY|nr:hypothetical protein TRVL_00882 [Trypanosoma vivax]KAH8608204.1 hypothetical protein ERJ75_001354300 [Trypanosoma vivax]CCC53667.1 conserved hypothetical protein [Trypanosoma vivax Y486]